jgi:hypothetical protein
MFSVLVGFISNSPGITEFLIFLSLLELNIRDFDIFDRISVVNRSQLVLSVRKCKLKARLSIIVFPEPVIEKIIPEWSEPRELIIYQSSIASPIDFVANKRSRTLGRAILKRKKVLLPGLFKSSS